MPSLYKSLNTIPASRTMWWCKTRNPLDKVFCAFLFSWSCYVSLSGPSLLVWTLEIRYILSCPVLCIYEAFLFLPVFLLLWSIHSSDLEEHWWGTGLGAAWHPNQLTLFTLSDRRGAPYFSSEFHCLARPRHAVPARRPAHFHLLHETRPQVRPSHHTLQRWHWTLRDPHMHRRGPRTNQPRSWSE